MRPLPTTSPHPNFENNGLGPETPDDIEGDQIHSPDDDAFESSFNIVPEKRGFSLWIGNLKQEGKQKIVQCLTAYKKRPLCWILTAVMVLVIVLSWASLRTPPSNPTLSNEHSVSSSPSNPHSSNATSVNMPPPHVTSSNTQSSNATVPATSVNTHSTNTSTTNSSSIPIIKRNVTEFSERKNFTNPTKLFKIDDLNIEPGDHIPMLEISITVYDADHLNIVIRDSKNARYEIPFEDPYPYASQLQNMTLEESHFDLQMNLDNFTFQVIRRDTQEIIFSLADRFVYSNLYTEFSFDLPTREIYGIGERLTSLQLKPGIYTIFVINRSGFIDTGEQGLNQEGHHPMYLVKERTGKYHINLIRNLSPQEATLREDTRVKWVLIGGVLDFNFFLGNTAEEAIEKYHRYCKGWIKPAFWHLGTHINRWRGYKNVGELEFVLSQHQKGQIPLDALWSDIDVYVNSWNMVYNLQRFPSDQIKALYNQYRKKWIPVIDPYVTEDALRNRRDLIAYNHPLLQSIILRDTKNNICRGMGQGGSIQLLDFLNPQTETYWNDALEALNSFCPLGGVWQDDNEVTVFKEGRDKLNNYKNSEFFKLPKYPGGKNFYDLPLPNPNCLHYNNLYEQDVRSLTSLFQSIYSYNFLKKRSPFPFILSRGTMFGGAQYAYHWIPDTFSDWPSMRATVGTVLTFQIFGYSMIGADVCGFIGLSRTNDELCARWYQASTFYPFHRNSHQPPNEVIDNSQEPYVYTGESYKGIVNSIYLRYSLLRHFYTLFFEKKIGERGFGMILKPLFIEFGSQQGSPAYGNIKNEEEFMVGSSLLVAPALYPQITEVEVYFPSDIRWYDLRTFQEIIPNENCRSNVSAHLGDITPYFLRGGHMIIQQETKNIYAAADLGNHFKLIAGLNTFNLEAKIVYKLMLISDASDENNVFNNCVLQDCLVKLELVISKSSEGELDISLITTPEETKENDEHIYIDTLYIMGLDFSKEPKSSGQVKNQDNFSSWTSSKINPNTVQISFMQPLEIKRSSHFTLSV